MQDPGHPGGIDPLAGFDPALLVGVSYASREHTGRGDGDCIVPPSGAAHPHLHFDGSLLRSFEPVSARDGLVVLRPHDDGDSVLVHNTFNGHVTPLLCVDDGEGKKWGNSGVFRPALLSVGGGGAGADDNSFELLAMDGCLRARIFSSEDGKWGPLRLVRPPPEHDHWTIINEAMGKSPIVIGRTVHWVCISTPERRSLPTDDDDVFILALHADGLAAAQPQATAIAPPPGCLRSCALAATADGRLGVVVAETVAAAAADALFAETTVISMWTLSSPAEGWSRQAVIDGEGISRQVTPGMHAKRTIWIMGFGERSGTVVFWMDRVGLVKLNVRTKKAVLLHGCTRPDTAGVVHACLHEIDLASLVAGLVH